jgi:anti-anti-sigma factor
VVIEFLSHAVADPVHADALGRELHALIRPDLPDRYLLDFHRVRSLSSTAFGALVSFALDVGKVGGQVRICNIDEFVRFGADVIRLGDYAPIHKDRQSALDGFATEGPSWKS